MVDRFLTAADRNLKLTDEQKTQLRETLGGLSQQAADQFRNNPPSAQARESVRALQAQLEKAAAAGEDSTVEQIQKQLDDPDRTGAFRQVRTRALDEVEKVLNPDQKEAFRQWRSLQESRLPSPLLANPESFKSLLGGIATLSDVQRNALEAAVARYQQQDAAADPNDPVARNALRNRLAREVQDVLKPAQQVLLTSAWRQQTAANNPRWQAGQGDNGSAGSGARRAGRRNAPASQDSPPDPANPQDTDAWTAYVQTFIARYGLDASQSQTAHSILQELLRRAAEYMSSHHADLEFLSPTVDQAATAETKAALDRDRQNLQRPIGELFQELKTRLAALPDSAQLAAASQPAPASRPALARRARTARSSATQPVSPRRRVANTP